jgi:DtxR family Mn-dependent transcriptional regulator
LSQRTVEEYLETIGALEERESPVSTTSIAQSMGVSLASVSEMLRRLAEKDLVSYTPYGGANLTKEGQLRFLRLTRRHRLWEVFLTRYLGIGWEDVYDHACSLEHATTDLVADKLATFLDNPEFCPHGSPIPKKSLKRQKTTGITMSDLEVGQSGKVLRIIIERDPEFLRYLTRQELTPGTRIKVMEKAPYDGTLTIDISGNSKAVGKEAANLIMVKPYAVPQKETNTSISQTLQQTPLL